MPAKALSGARIEGFLSLKRKGLVELSMWFKQVRRGVLRQASMVLPKRYTIGSLWILTACLETSLFAGLIRGCGKKRYCAVCVAGEGGWSARDWADWWHDCAGSSKRHSAKRGAWISLLWGFLGSKLRGESLVYAQGVLSAKKHKNTRHNRWKVSFARICAQWRTSARSSTRSAVDQGVSQTA